MGFAVRGPGWGTHPSTRQDPGPEGSQKLWGGSWLAPELRAAGWGAVTRSSLLSSDGDLGKAKPLSVARGACGLLAVQVGPESI